MKKMNLKELITMIKQNIQNIDVEVEIIDLPNNKIKHIIIGNKKVIQPKKQSSMTTKQFQDHVIQFINNQKSFNEYVIEFINEQKEFNQIILKRLDRIESCPTIRKELNN